MKLYTENGYTQKMIIELNIKEVKLLLWGLLLSNGFYYNNRDSFEDDYYTVEETKINLFEILNKYFEFGYLENYILDLEAALEEEYFNELEKVNIARIIIMIKKIINEEGQKTFLFKHL